MKKLLTAFLVLTLAGCAKAPTPVAGYQSAAALDALAKKKAAPKDADDKAVAGKIATKLSGYWEDGGCLLTIAPKAGEPTAVLIGGETVVTDAKGKPVALSKLKRGMAVEVTLGPAAKGIKSEPATYTATKLIVKKAAPKAPGIEGADYDVLLDP